MISVGVREFGKVDAVPGFFHVVTRFGHLTYLPLIPTGSLLISERERDRGRAIRIPLSFKSIAVAWLRGGLILAMFMVACIGYYREQ